MYRGLRNVFVGNIQVQNPSMSLKQQIIVDTVGLLSHLPHLTKFNFREFGDGVVVYF